MLKNLMFLLLRKFVLLSCNNNKELFPTTHENRTKIEVQIKVQIKYTLHFKRQYKKVY